MNKTYSRINWQNSPETTTPLNETNLNKIDYAVNEIDNRVITLDTTKVETSSIQNYIKDWSMDETTGVITVTYVNNTTQSFDLNIEKIPVSFTLSAEGVLTMKTADGTEFTANIKDLIPNITFTDSDTISSTKNGDNYTFNVIDGSITEDKLQTDFLADIRVETATSTTNANTASAKATEAQSWAIGGTGTRSGEDSNNAKYWSEQAQAAAGGDYVAHSEVGVTVASLDNGKVPTSQLPDLGVESYNDLTNKPSINGIELSGNKTSSELNISYNDLANKPTIPPAYELPIASADTLGGIKVGDNLAIDSDGKLSASASVTVDSELSLTSENPVQNKVIAEKINEIEEQIPAPSIDLLDLEWKCYYNNVESTYGSKTGSKFEVTVSDTSIHHIVFKTTDAIEITEKRHLIQYNVSCSVYGASYSNFIYVYVDGSSGYTELLKMNSTTSYSGTLDLSAYIGHTVQMGITLWRYASESCYLNFSAFALVGNTVTTSPDWELIGSSTGTGTVAYDGSKYNEVFVMVKVGSYDYIHFSAPIIAVSTATNFRQGSYYNTYTYYDARVQITAIGSYIISCMANGTNVTTTSTIIVYGRK